jgi:uncharacterized protein (PEP-CTERM system associated)
MVHRAMITDETNPSRPNPSRLGSLVPATRTLGLAAVLLLARTGCAAAFPFLDATNADQVPQGTELASPDAQDLQHQLRLANGFGAPAGGGWTFVPRIDWQEELTDNALQAHSPRRADLVSFFTPGINIVGDTPRVQATFDFAPTLAIYARTSDLNALTEQMNGLASITLVPDLFYVDVRALAGVQSQFGGIGSVGAVGAPANTALTAQTAALAGANGQPLNRNDEVQTTSFGLSPYLLQHYGDWGTAKLGYSVGVTKSNTLNGFASLPFPSGSGANAQTLLSNEEIANFTTGEIMQFFQDSFNVDLQQTQSTAGAGVIDPQTGAPLQTQQNTSSTNATIKDTITYQATRGLSVFAMGGHEDIVYSGFGAQSIHDLIWSLGTTWVPNPDSSLTVSYGHQDGFNSLTVNGFYALTARTMLTASYGSMLGTQLQFLQNQLNLEGAGPNGTVVNAQTGAANSLFGATNALALQDGVFRTTTLAVGGTTTLDRDIITLNLLLATQTSSGGSSSSAQTKTFSGSWLHQMRPDMTVSAAVSYAIQDQSTGVVSFVNPGNNTSVVTNLAWQWQISDTLTGSVRYSFFERTSPATAFDIYENMFIVGLSKHF